MSICSVPVGDLVTEHPQANFFPNAFDASDSLTPNRSRPVTVVIIFFLFRVFVSMMTWVRKIGV